MKAFKIYLIGMEYYSVIKFASKKGRKTKRNKQFGILIF